MLEAPMTHRTSHLRSIASAIAMFFIAACGLHMPLAHAKGTQKAVDVPSGQVHQVASKRKAGDSANKVAGKAGKSKAAAKKSKASRVKAAPPRPSMGMRAGLHQAADPLDLKSSVALVIDQDTHEVLFRKNDQAVLPIASLTKLMTGLLVSEAKLPADELITITQEDVDTEKGSRSRLKVGTTLTRGELMHLSLMSSENRAAHALGRTWPGGMDHFVRQMNAKAKLPAMWSPRASAA
jgi:serine-type D-Ala-D-Ala endopeptidase (penicillin-binding protein 7)